MRARLIWIPLLLCLAGPGGAAGTTTAMKPSLIVVISIDQFRYDYLERFAPYWSQGGFRRLLADGADFVDARYRHAATFTGPGHAAIGTGCDPSATGIIGNYWFDPSAPYDKAAWDYYFDDVTPYAPEVGPSDAKLAAAGDERPWYETGGVIEYCVHDAKATRSSGNGMGMSPRHLDRDSVGDALKATNPSARVYSVALKDRAAILMAGHNPDAAYWFDPKAPGFVSSSWYRSDSQLLRTFNETLPSWIPPSKSWARSTLIPGEDWARVTYDPAEVWPLKHQKYRGAFEHPIADYKALTYTPFANDMLLDFASRLLESQQLGGGPAPDLLYIGISAPDYIGHYYGPDSMEVADDAVRLDRSLAQFFSWLDTRLPGKVLIAVTADHGVQRNPEIAKRQNPRYVGGRLDLRNPMRNARLISELPPERIDLERQLAARFHIAFHEDAPLSKRLLLFFEEPSIYLNHPRLAKLHLKPAQVKRELRNLLLELPAVHRVDLDTTLRTPNPGARGVELAVRRSFRADRSGDLFITLRPGYVWNTATGKTTHGQPVPDDQHVPLLLWGPGIRPGRYALRVAPTDLAVTLGHILGVKAGGPETHTLPCLR